MSGEADVGALRAALLARRRKHFASNLSLSYSPPLVITHGKKNRLCEWETCEH